MDELALSPLQIPRLGLAERLLSDERLARLVSRGNTQAFGTLYARHEPALSRYCRAIVRDEQDCQDALQSAMMHALAALQAGERELKVRPWLYRIVHNESISLLRRRRVTADVLADDQIPAPDDVESVLETRERLALLVADLQALSERQRAALVMRELSGLSIEEIAGALSTSPGAAKQTLFEARWALQELAEGRAMECDAIRRLVSERDGRVLRGRRLRSHLRACPSCDAFRAAIETRSADLRVLAPPLPALAASGLLARLLGGAGHAGGGPGGGALAGGSLPSGALAGGPLTGGGALGGGSLGVKALAAIALVTAASTGTVELTTGAHGRAASDGAAVAARAMAAVPPHGLSAAGLGAGRAPTPLQSRSHGAGAEAHARVVTPGALPATGGPAGGGSPAAATAPSSPRAVPAPTRGPSTTTGAAPKTGTGSRGGSSHAGGQAHAGGGSGAGQGSAHRSGHAHGRAEGPPSQQPGTGTQAPSPTPPPEQAPSTGAGGGAPSPGQSGGAIPSQPGGSAGHASPHAAPQAH